MSFLFLTGTACTPEQIRLLKSGGQKVPGPNGYSDYVVTCYDVAGCYYKADYQCDGDYDVVETTNGKSASGEFVYNMLITCR